MNRSTSFPVRVLPPIESRLALRLILRAKCDRSDFPDQDTRNLEASTWSTWDVFSGEISHHETSMLNGSPNESNRKPHEEREREREDFQEPSCSSYPSGGTRHISEPATILAHPTGPSHDSRPSCNLYSDRKRPLS